MYVIFVYNIFITVEESSYYSCDKVEFNYLKSFYNTWYDDCQDISDFHSIDISNRRRKSDLPITCYVCYASRLQFFQNYRNYKIEMLDVSPSNFRQL